MDDDGVFIGVFPKHRGEIFDMIDMERIRQDKLWGEQSWPDGTTGSYTDIANAYKDACDQATRDGELTWHDILLEEVFEALAEEDPDTLETELVQVIAVAVNWVEDIRSKRNGR